MNITLFDLAQRFVGIREVSGRAANPAILAMLKLDGDWPQDDSVPWCSAFVNYVAWLMRLPRSKSLRARSWLQVGRPVGMPVVGWDVVVLKRGSGEQPGPEVIDAPGHTGFFAGWARASGMTDEVHLNAHTAATLLRNVLILGGNQSDSVSIAPYDSSRILGIRRLYG